MRNRVSRASDDDREQVARVLQDHAVAGRLTTDELDARVGAALRARTLLELDALLFDLPRRRRLAPASARTGLTLLLHGLVLLLVGLVVLTVAIVVAIAWAGSRLVAAAATRSTASRRVRALRAGP